MPAKDNSDESEREEHQHEGRIWQDREIKFDVLPTELNPRKGEFKIDAIEGIEDTKGNNGERGILSCTNLRLVWSSAKSSKVNLSIGYNCIVNISVHFAKSRIRGKTQALFVLTKYGGSRFEFIFTNLIKNSPRLFSTVQSVFKSYESSTLYREMKLRAAVIKDKELVLLPQEEIFSKIVGVWNLSSEQGNLGVFFISNVRLVWFAEMAENFNVSIPYMQMKNVKIRESRFGTAFVVETSSQSGQYVLGFRIDPSEKLKQVYQEVYRLHQLFSKNPVFGVDYTIEDIPKSLDQLKVPKKIDDIEIIQNDDDIDPLAAYYADSNKNVDSEPIFNEQLGLAIEKLKDGISIDNLWKLKPPPLPSLTTK